VQKLLKEKGPRQVATLSALPWEGEAAEEVPEAAAEETPVAVIVGPWPRAGAEEPADAEVGELDADEESAGFTLASEDEPPPAPEPRPASAVSVAVPARPAPRAPSRDAGESAVARLREALSGADRDRLRAQAARLAPLVRRLAALRDQGPPPAR
jgi:hypothetical protein